LIPAAGAGTRLGLGPKALLELEGKPLLSWVSRKALRFSNDVVVTVPPGTKARYQQLCPGCNCIDGGATRQKSVTLLVQQSARPWVIIIDVTRPFATLALYTAVLEAARDKGATGAFLRSDVPVAWIENNRVIQTLPSAHTGIFQSPHAFSRALLLELIAQANTESWQLQSTLELALQGGVDVGVVPGEKSNIKLTSIEDWRSAHYLTEFLH
jgi:2-C-methyl-D-erythritol 4-phosphate cytidylyltransferase